MANPNKPTGFSPVQYLGGSPWNGQARIYSVPTNQSTAIYIGDPVASSGDGDAFGIAGVVRATAGSAVRGIVVAAGLTPQGGPYVNVNNLSQLWVPASQTPVYYVAVVDDPDVIFECQEIGTGTQFTSAEIGLNCNFTLGTAGVAPFSGALLDNATEAGTSTLNCKLLGLSQYPAGTNVFGAYAKWLVLLNNHELKAGTTGV